MDEGSARRMAATYKQDSTNIEWTQTMSWVEFEPTIPAFERAKTVDALDRAATVIGRLVFTVFFRRKWACDVTLTSGIYIYHVL
jgi:hypothetical protein